MYLRFVQLEIPIFLFKILGAILTWGRFNKKINWKGLNNNKYLIFYLKY